MTPFDSRVSIQDSPKRVRASGKDWKLFSCDPKYTVQKTVLTRFICQTLNVQESGDQGKRRSETGLINSVWRLKMRPINKGLRRLWRGNDISRREIQLENFQLPAFRSRADKRYFRLKSAGRRQYTYSRKRTQPTTARHYATRWPMTTHRQCIIREFISDHKCQ